MRSAHSPNSTPLKRPPPLAPSSPHLEFCFGGRLLWGPASGTRAAERSANIWARTQPSWLSVEHGVPRALIGRLYRALGFQAGSTVPLLSPCSILCLGSNSRWVSKQTGWAEQQTATWERAVVSSPPETDTGTGLLLSWVGMLLVDWQRSKSCPGWLTGLVDSREGRVSSGQLSNTLAPFLKLRCWTVSIIHWPRFFPDQPFPVGMSMVMNTQTGTALQDGSPDSLAVLLNSSQCSAGECRSVKYS